ncbi:MAG: hypothetical protein ACR2PA_06665 [Hyphomicrobiaceae bacterium]
MAVFQEIREADAPPDIAALYTDIKAATGIPQVNLIFRHLATCPGVLEWTWGVLGAAYRSGQVTRLVPRLTTGLSIRSNVAIGAGLSPKEAVVLADVLRFYNHGNAHNLVALTALARFGQSSQAERNLEHGQEQEDRIVRFPPIPPLPRRDALDAATLAQVDDLAGRQGGARLGVTPSMYLHLARWPSAMQATHRYVSSMIDSGELDRLADQVIQTAETLSGELGKTLTPTIARPPANVLDPALVTVARFVRHTIPEMVVIGHALAGPVDG